MDIKKKLDLYRSANKQITKREHNPSLSALREIFKAEICAPTASYLKLSRNYSFSFPEQVKLNLLTKNRINKPLPLNQCLFFDLETTGLAGGAGTYPFLLGFGYFNEDVFTVEQFFLPDYGREYYLFKYLEELFAKFSYLVSFNGKSYDLPLLRNRFILNRFQMDWKRFEHIDLLHISRRLWKDSQPSLELTAIERSYLNRTRTDDIPGASIPEAYFTFLRTGVIHDVKKIIEHNYLDIISLAELIVLVSKIEENPQTVEDETVLIRMAKLAYALTDEQMFQRICAIFNSKKRELPDKIKLWKSLLAKRRGRWEEALELWLQLVDTREYLFFALEELAKYYEHQKKDFREALQFTKRAIDNLQKLAELYPYAAQEEHKRNFRKRAERLRIKTA